jgi:uncharacterized membrane protein YcaP (DUF421 family)
MRERTHHDIDSQQGADNVDLLHLGIPAWEFVVRCIVIDAVLLVALRLFGKRELGQFTLYDLVLILLVANAVQPAMTGTDSSLLGGLIIIGVLVLFNFLLSRLDQNRVFHRLLVPAPRIIIENGQFNDRAMEHEGVDREEVETAIREHGVDSVSECRLGVLEPDGSISIVPMDSKTVRTRRTVRYLRHG